MNINSAFPSKYLKADVDVTDDVVLTIKTVKLENVGTAGKQENKPVVYFTELDKGLVLNKTNATMIANIAKSDDTDDWRDTKIRLISTEVEYQGQIVMGLRVRQLKRAPATRPAPPTASPEAEVVDAPNDDDIPF
jgi:hypothetical protein